MSGKFFTQRVAISTLYRIVAVGTGCGTLATYIADNVAGVGTVLTVGLVVTSVLIGIVLYIAVRELQGESYIIKRCPTCDNVTKRIPAWIKGTVSAKALTMLRMEVVIFSTYFALSYIDSVYTAAENACGGLKTSRRRVMGTMIAACVGAAVVSLALSSVVANRSGPSCCSDCTLNSDNRFVTTRVKTS